VTGPVGGLRARPAFVGRVFRFIDAAVSAQADPDDMRVG
jgi:hypothetical protein